ncbi:putative aspartic proteinase precursor [Fusarium austroafricanum]|uniref:Putative aspartic proteinase n=1 Tax=Fusarium austroafricanum TaxID=2364996 RepID=A0A8H4KPH8_9HYPO|nr:putative aspartic proteinase precursor [Fusarium austroafricanum]
MSLKLLQLAVATVALAASVNGLSMPDDQGAAFSVDVFTPSTPEEFDPVAEKHRLQAKFPTTYGIGNTKEVRTEKQAGAVKVKPSSSGLSFYVPTVIGNQTFKLIYDTGSADLWVYSNESSPWQSLDHLTYKPTSSAKRLPNYTWAIKYANGEEVSGVVFTDTVKAGPVVAHNQAVQAALINPFEFGSDGILGLAFSAINTVKPNKQKTFFETVMPTLKQKLFAANLRVDGKPATWDFGYIDNSKFKGKIAYTPVTGNKHWSMNVSSWAVGGGLFTDSKKKVGEVIVDSGTSLVYLPDAVVKDYYSHIKGYKFQQGGTHTFPCNSSIPNLNFKIEGTTLSVPGRDVNYTVYDPAQGICAGGITTQLNNKYSVLGNLFMRNYYVVHSQEEATPKLGFALH